MPETTSAPTTTVTLADETAGLVKAAGTLLQTPQTGWNCEGTPPKRSADTSLYGVLDELRTNCAWSEASGVVKIRFRCFLSTQAHPDKQAQCKVLLNKLATDLGVISIAEAGSIPDQKMIDGVQKSENGATTWTIGPGVSFVVDVAKWASLRS